MSAAEALWQETASSLRAAGTADLPVIVRLKLAMFAETGRVHVLAPDAYERMLEIYCALYERKLARHFVIQQEGQIVACAGAFLKDDLPFCFYRVPVYGFIGDVYTLPQYRRGGCAQRLVTEAIDWLRRQGVEVVRLVATPQGRNLYTRLGFQPADDMMLRFDEVGPGCERETIHV
jgi:GNAT superfamily N-acetyltransferase